MQPPTSFLARYNGLAGPVYLVLTAALGLAVLIQIFLAGEASMIEPDDWGTPCRLGASVSVAQRSAAVCGVSRPTEGRVRRTQLRPNRDHRPAICVDSPRDRARAGAVGGSSRVCGALLLAYVTFVLQEWRQGTSWPGDSSSDLDQSKSAAAEIASLAGCEKTLGGRRKWEES